MPRNIDELIDHTQATFTNDDIKAINVQIVSSHAIKETLHLIMRLTRPLIKKIRFEVPDFKQELIKCPVKTSDIINKVDYSQISSVVYREVLKRKKLWKVGEQLPLLKCDNFSSFKIFIDRTLEFLSIREDQELFRNMNEFYNIILKAMYVVSLSFQERVFANHISHI
jgi:hypothetical protein